MDVKENKDKKNLIIKTAEEMMKTTDIQSISVSSIAKKAGISKGSIYYYFESKEEIIDAVFESSYANLIEGGKQLVQNQTLNVFEKMKIMYDACLKAATALNIQTDRYNSYNDKQNIAHYHQQFTNSVIKNCQPVLTEILKQGIKEGSLECDNPKVMSEIILMTLTIIMDNQLLPCTTEEIIEKLRLFSIMQEKSMNMKEGAMSFLFSS